MATEHPAGPGPPPGAGWWPSSWSAAAVAAGKVSRSGLHTDVERFVWSESRPAQGGRQVVVATPVDAGPPGTAPDPVELSPPGVSVRSRVHEYGGTAAQLADGVLFYVDLADQRWYRYVPGGGTPPVALGPEADPDAGSVRAGDGRLVAPGRWLVAVEEEVGPEGTAHRLVAWPTGPDGPPSERPPSERRPCRLVDDGSFVSSPRPSPDGRHLAWVTWSHPDMPWDRSSLWMCPLEDRGGALVRRAGWRVAGGDDRSIGQPRWLADGSLLFVDDESGWWLPHRLDRRHLDGSGAARPLVDREAEFHAPDWVLGQATLAELPGGALAARMRSGGRDHLVRLTPGPVPDAPWDLEVIDQPFLSLSGVAATSAGRLAVLGTSATEASAVVEVDPSVPGGRRLSDAPAVVVGPGEVARSEAFTAATPAGPVPGLYFPPTNPRIDPAPLSPPPLVVFCHGGPTGSAEPGFDPVVQFFTSRGFAVAAVDYRGSAGYGRAYRERLAGGWGEADVEDCVAYAAALVGAGRVDGQRMAIRGTSAGGLTALGALLVSDRFAGAATWYGVTDLEALAADTHDFESRYVDGLVGPWPEAASRYRDRSPLFHPDRVHGAVLLLQGADDPVVPADQAVRFAERLREAGVDCRLTVFAGESHGFRRAETIAASLEAELDFYRRLFETSAAPTAG